MYKQVQFVLVLLMGFLSAHDYWIDSNHFTAEPEQSVTIYLCGGHYFPESILAVKDKLVFKTCIIDPSGNSIPFETVKDNKRRRGAVTFTKQGTHLAVAVLKRPQLKEPEYWMKAIFIVGSETVDTSGYKIGEGLEVVPNKNISTLKSADNLPLQALFNGDSVQGTFTVSIGGKKNLFLRTDNEGRANLPVKRGGKYLITFSHKGKGCSLTFQIDLTGGN